MKKLDSSFYQRNDVVLIAKELLGKRLCTNINGALTSGIIVETEAYSGRNDQACHANNGKLTKRTSIMFEEGGLAYVYLCYGIHNLFNIVTNTKGNADAVLIRAIEPDSGFEQMNERRNFPKRKYAVGSGPGCVSQALGINQKHYGTSLLGENIWIEKGRQINEVQSSPRIGVDYAGEDALKEWRFYIEGDPWVSASPK